MGLHQSKISCTAKGNMSKIKKEPTVWENIFAYDTSDKGLISKVYKELTGLHSRKTNNPVKSGRRTWTDTSPRRTYAGPRDIWKDAQHHYPSERCKLKPQRDTTSQNGHHKQINKQMLERMWRKGNRSALLVGMQSGVATVENSMEFTHKTKNETAFWPSNSTAGAIPWKPWNTNPKEPLHPNVHSSTIYKSQVLEAT